MEVGDILEVVKALPAVPGTVSDPLSGDRAPQLLLYWQLPFHSSYNYVWLPGGRTSLQRAVKVL